MISKTGSVKTFQTKSMTVSHSTISIGQGKKCSNEKPKEMTMRIHDPNSSLDASSSEDSFKRGEENDIDEAHPHTPLKRVFSSQPGSHWKT